MSSTEPSRTKPPTAGARNGRRRTGRPTGDRPGAPDRGLLRHQARTLALQVLFEIELTGHDVRAALDHAFAGPEAGEDDGEAATPAIPADVQGYAERLVHGALLHLYRIDPILTAAAPNFNGEQTPAVDRSVLRLATYELMYQPDIPPRVAIDEAVELAKHYGGDGSSRFVNGVLRTVLKRVQDGPPDAGNEAAGG